MKISLRFFASVREAIGEDRLEHQTGASNVRELRAELAARGEPWPLLLEEATLAAVNQELCDNDQPLGEGDEVAFFPYMTGG